MAVVYCLDCDRKLPITPKQRQGDIIVCPICDTEFELVKVNPTEIEWVYDEHEYEYELFEEDN